MCNHIFQYWFCYHELYLNLLFLHGWYINHRDFGGSHQTQDIHLNLIYKVHILYEGYIVSFGHYIHSKIQSINIPVLSTFQNFICYILSFNVVSTHIEYIWCISAFSCSLSRENSVFIIKAWKSKKWDKYAVLVIKQAKPQN